VPVLFCCSNKEKFRKKNRRLKKCAEKNAETSISTDGSVTVPTLYRQFIIGDLVTIAPGFRTSITDFDFEKYIGIILKSFDDNEYIVYWTTSPIKDYHRGMWSGDHLVKIEEYQKAIRDKKRLHIKEI